MVIFSLQNYINNKEVAPFGLPLAVQFIGEFRNKRR